MGANLKKIVKLKYFPKLSKENTWNNSHN